MNFPFSSGHLVGSIGEVWAAYTFDLRLLPPSEAIHDAIASDGRLVQVKATQGNTIGISSCPDELIVLLLSRDGGVEVVYDGLGDIAWAATGKTAKIGQPPPTVEDPRAPGPGSSRSTTPAAGLRTSFTPSTVLRPLHSAGPDSSQLAHKCVGPILSAATHRLVGEGYHAKAVREVRAKPPLVRKGAAGG